MNLPVPTPLSRFWPLLVIAGTLLALAALSLNAGTASGQSVPSVTVSSALSADNTHTVDEKIRVPLAFTEVVDVSGAPRLKIKMDPDYGENWANYESGTGTANLTLAHEVLETFGSTQGIAVLANTLELNGGTIRSATGTNVLLAHTGQGHDSEHKVDWQVQNSAATDGPTITGGPTALSFAEYGTSGNQCCQAGRLCHPSGLPSPWSTTQPVVATYTATVPEDHTIIWSVEGTDAAKFTISADGALSFKASPNFDSPGDADGNNTYLVTVKATANGNSDTRAVAVTVTDGNDPPAFVQKKEALFVEEGYAHYLYDFGATDPQGNTMTFS